MEQTSKRSKILQIIALGVAGGSIYLIPYIRYVFYDWQMSAMGISNTQLGLLTTAYTIGNIILYIPGGVIADKFSTKKSIIIALSATTLLTLIFAFRMGSFAFALIVWALFAVTTTFLFWDSLFKTLRLVANEDEQGFMFGLYYMWGIFGLSSLINLAALAIICAFLLIKGLPAISWSFLTEMPRDSMAVTLSSRRPRRAEPCLP